MRRPGRHRPRCAKDDPLRARAAGAAGAPVPGPDETPRDVVAALLEDYRQAAQDLISTEWGEPYPETAAQEDAALRALHARCEAWWVRYEAAVSREARRGGTP
jgi:hypothetical protein